MAIDFEVIDKNCINFGRPYKKEVAEEDCTEVGLAEKSKAAAREKVRERQILF